MTVLSDERLALLIEYGDLGRLGDANLGMSEQVAAFKELVILRKDTPWRCFYCDAIFHNLADAEAHFGRRDGIGEKVPACDIDTQYVRDLEAKCDDAMKRVSASAWVTGTTEDRERLETAAARLFPAHMTEVQS